MDDELIAANTIGNILHKALENLYENNKNQPIKVDCYKNSDRILLDAFRSVAQSALPEFGKNKLIFEVIHKLWNDFVRNEKKLIEDGNILIIKDLEAEYFVMSEISQNGISIPWKLKGKIDRIDNLNGETRIIDFKTGKVIDTELKINNLDINELTYKPKAFQLIIYTYLMQNNVQSMDISFNMAGVYKLLRTTSGIIPLQIKDGNCSASEIKTILDSIVNEIFNPEIEFNQTTETDACKYCTFKDLCERSSKDRN
jgi:ATP-dependent helicase/DNAse subunit B